MFFFIFLFVEKIPTAIKLEGGGGLNGTVIKKNNFFAASLNWINRIMRIWFTNLQTSYVRLRIIESTVTSNKSLIIVYYALKKNKQKISGFRTISRIMIKKFLQ